MRGGLGVFCMALWVPGLLGCAAEPREVRLSLQPPDALGCRATEVTGLRVTPLGDFPAEVRPTIPLDPAGGPVAIERFPVDTQWVRVEAEGRLGIAEPWRGGGLVPVVGEGTLPVPMLRFGRGCALSDPSARVPEGAVVLPLPDGRLWVAGGHEAGARADVVLVRPGERLSEARLLRLFTPRIDAGGAVLSDGRVVVVGGAVADDGGALDTVELFRVQEGDEQALDGGFLVRARRAAAVAPLADGSLLVVGGRDRDAVGDAERVVFEDGVRAVTLGSAVPRWGASALSLDDGSVLIVGGEDGEGASPAIERFDGTTLERLDDVAARAGAAWVALPGARALRIGGREAGTASAEVDLLLDAGRTLRRLGPLLEAPEAPVAAGLPDGRALVISRGAEGRAYAQRLDPGGTREGGAIEPSRLASRLVRLVDGTLVEADASGMSLLRLDAQSVFDDPQASLFPAQAEQRAELSLDVAEHWTVRGDLLLAEVDGARLDLPTARFLGFAAEVELDGAGAVLLDPPGRPAIRIEVSGQTVRLGACESTRTTPLVIERRDDGLRLGETVCALEAETLGDEERVAVGVSMSRGAGVRRISVRRTAF